MPITLNGDGAISGLTSTGISAVQKLPAGTVLQVVQGTTTATTTTTGTTPVATNLTASITPSSASSKILIISTFSLYTAQSNTKAYTSLYRNSTNLSNSAGGAYLYSGATGGVQITTGINLLDSPATTSATSYTIYLFGSATGNSVSFNADTMGQQIILMEIAG